MDEISEDRLRSLGFIKMTEKMPADYFDSQTWWSWGTQSEVSDPNGPINYKYIVAYNTISKTVVSRIYDPARRLDLRKKVSKISDLNEVINFASFMLSQK